MNERNPRVIKRYANRKLYDLQQSSYITHEEIAQLVRDGEDVRIIDNRSKEDLTTSTLAQILLDEEKRSTRAMPVDTIRSLFQQGGEFIQKKIKQPVVNLRDEAEKNVKRVFAGMRKDERPAPPPAPEPPPAPKHRPADAIRDAIEERWQEFQATLAQLDYPRRIGELERRVALLEQALVTLVGHAAGGALEHVLNDTLAGLRRSDDAESAET
jgi:polyhydroxyalkanoate synthesis repressor PhaR